MQNTTKGKTVEDLTVQKQPLPGNTIANILPVFLTIPPKTILFHHTSFLKDWERTNIRNKDHFKH
jgi:hypothetical protein